MCGGTYCSLCPKEVLPRGKRPLGGRKFKRWLVVTKLDFVEWSAFVFVTVWEHRLSLN